MYIVASKWRITSFDEAQEGKGRVMRKWMLDQPGVEFCNVIKTEDGNGVAIVMYKDELTYRALVEGDDSPFERKARELQMESMGEWLWSERGETVDD